MAKRLLRAVFGMVLLVPGFGFSQSYPTKPIRLIVPTAAGGGPDINARLIAGELSKQLGQQVVVDNRPGASGIVGFETLAHAAPDGYTMARLTSNFTTNPSLFAKLPYDSIKDIQPVVLESSGTFLLTVTNPATVLSFAAMFSALTLGGDPRTSPWVLVGGVFAGSAAWWFLLSFSVSKLRARIEALPLHWVNRASGMLLVGFGGWAAWTAARL